MKTEKINLKAVLDRAGMLYCNAKIDKGVPVESAPNEIISDQVKAVAKALVEAINGELP